jgi:molecular chaperone HtpG
MSEPTPSPTAAKTHAFQAEVSQVLRLVIHSLYSHKEIFLRELVSNASDALSRLRFAALTQPELLAEDPTLEVRLRVDRAARTLHIEDTGIGMTEEELVTNLGTVAHSGSRAFLEKLAEGAKKDANLIGQFGVGFYSAYLVADRVTVVTRAAAPGSRAFKWTSDAGDTFTVEPAERASRGTELVLHLKEDQAEFLESWRLRELVLRYSDYVSYPIKLEETREKDGKTETTLEQVNRASALWQRNKSELTDEQYTDFYKHLTRDFEAPLARAHFRVEGTQEFVGLLYVPAHPPFDLNDPRRRRGVRLFVRRVFIMDDCEEILPQWLRFVRGVVDSDDLPLNVSRELLQDSAILKAIRKQVTKQTLSLLEEMAKERPDDYAKFWTAFGTVLKEGLALDHDHTDKLGALVRYESSRGEAPTSLADYVARMKEGQEAIYYISGESKQAASGSPHTEALLARGYEVLYMTDPVDEWATEGLGEFGGKKLVSAMRANLPLDESDAQKKEAETQAASLAPLTARIGKVLEAVVREVKVTHRLTESPCCLTLADGATAPHLERLLRERGKGLPPNKRVFEVNPTHPVITSLSELVGRDPAAPRIDEWIEVLFDQAVLAEGGQIDDPGRFAKRVAALLTLATQGAPAA